jgi:hypothetical protein
MTLKCSGGKDAGQGSGRPLHIKVPVGGGRQFAVHLACSTRPPQHRGSEEGSEQVCNQRAGATPHWILRRPRASTSPPTSRRCGPRRRRRVPLPSARASQFIAGALPPSQIHTTGSCAAAPPYQPRSQTYSRPLPPTSQNNPTPPRPTHPRSRPSRWCGCPCRRRGGRRGPGGTTTGPARPWRGRGTRARATRCCAGPKAGGGAGGWGCFGGGRGGHPTALETRRVGRGGRQRLPLAGGAAARLRDCNTRCQVGKIAVNEDVWGVRIGVCNTSAESCCAHTHTHTHARTHTCREGAMSSSLATTSCVATSGFHCSAEQRLRLRTASGGSGSVITGEARSAEKA